MLQTDLSKLIRVVENYSICPIVFNMYEQLKSEINNKH